MRSDRLFSRDFTLMILGQIISLFGNAILRFALSLYVLDTTGSAAAFGCILAVSMVPTILCSPLGGVLADRVPRQRIMWGLDFFTAALVLGYGLFFASRGTVLAVGVLMVLLAAIQALYQPSVQASIPALASEDHLPAANGVVAQVQALANLLGPILGGMLYGWVGLLPMVAVGGAWRFLLGTSLLLLPMALALALGIPSLAAYGVILVSVLLGMACAMLFTVSAQTYLQRATPPHLLGKVASFVAAISTCAMPLGQALYGLLFDALQAHIWVVVALGMGASLLVTFSSVRALGRLPALDEAPSGGYTEQSLDS